MDSERPGAYLRGRHVAITGGGRGIGAAIALELARLGADLTLMGRTAAPLGERAAELSRECGARVESVLCDVSDEASVAGAFAAARARLGDPYVLVNNAGQAEAAPFVDMRRELWDRLLAVDLTGAFLCTQQVLPAMLHAGGGRVINIASTAGLRGYTKLAAYCAAKHGLIGLTRALALETVKQGVTVNAVCPAYAETDMGQSAVDAVAATLGTTPADALAVLTKRIPLGRMIRPAEVASAVAWLCSPGASAVTGQAIVVAGGEVM